MRKSWSETHGRGTWMYLVGKYNATRRTGQTNAGTDYQSTVFVLR